MLGLWLFAGYQVTLRMRAAQEEALDANARYLQAQDLLSSVRTQVLLASVLVRDALLDPSQAEIEAHRQQVQAAYGTIDATLAGYVPYLGLPVERERVGRLRDEIREFRSATDDVLASDRRRWSTDARTLLRRFMPKREAAIRVSEETQALNRAAFIEQQRSIATMQASMQRQVWTVFGAALAVSLVIGGLALRHSARLERWLTDQRQREERSATDLQRLSASHLQVREDEQRRIARELHDDVGQALGVVKVELAVAQRRLDRLDGGPGLLSDAQSSADSALQHVREISHMLHPSALDDLGLVAVLESQLADFGRRHQVTVDFTPGASGSRLGEDAERAVYRIVQEALTNIARHAHARTVRVSLIVGDFACRLLIEDDGIGFDVADVERPGRRRGLGLLGIRERVSQLRGSVVIESGRSGTRVDVTLPGVTPWGAGAGASRAAPAISGRTAEARHE
jgi:signal transduction histidine kinase